MFASRAAPVPVSFFGIPVGLLAFANTWHVGVRLWQLPGDVAQALSLAGLAAWAVLLALESVILQRASVGTPLPAALRPVLGIQLAPAVVGGGAWMSLTTGAPDMFAWLLLGYGLYQALMLLRMLPWIREQAFAPGYWAFSFGTAALPALAMRMAERGATGLVAELAPALFVAANVVFALLIVQTLALLARGTLLPAAAPAA